jgi:hypothetical protein
MKKDPGKAAVAVLAFDLTSRVPSGPARRGKGGGRERWRTKAKSRRQGSIVRMEEGCVLTPELIDTYLPLFAFLPEQATIAG